MATTFNPNNLPADVREAFKMGPLAWMLMVQRAVKAGITDIDRLASIVFYMHHPERNGQPIGAGEQTMINQWKSFKVLIAPLVKYAPGPASPASPSSGGGGGAAPTESQKAKAAELIAKLKFDGKLTEVQASWASKITRGVYESVDTTVSATTFVLDIAELAGLLSESVMLTATGLTAMGIASGVMLIAAPFLQFIGFAYALLDSAEIDLRLYRSVAVGYTVTAWAYGESRSSSPVMRERLMGPMMYGRPRTGTEVDSNWMDAKSETIARINKLVAKIGTPTAKKSLQLALQMGGKVPLAKSVMMQIAGDIKSAIEADNLRRIAAELNYPA